jgi:hypothetical protein
MNIKLAPANGIVQTKVLANPAGAKQAAEKPSLRSFLPPGGSIFVVSAY